eukprot:10353415-Lingulodinium_polyedra.AAC.1
MSGVLMLGDSFVRRRQVVPRPRLNYHPPPFLEVGSDLHEHAPDASTLERGHALVECRPPAQTFSRERLLQGIPGIAVMEE